MFTIQHVVYFMKNCPVSPKMFTNERLFTIQAFTITRVHCTYTPKSFFWGSFVVDRHQIPTELVHTSMMKAQSKICPFVSAKAWCDVSSRQKFSKLQIVVNVTLYFHSCTGRFDSDSFQFGFSLCDHKSTIKTLAEILTSNSVSTKLFYLGCNQDNNHGSNF